MSRPFGAGHNYPFIFGRHPLLRKGLPTHVTDLQCDSGAVTDIDGTYRITGVKPDAVITVTAIGFKTLEEPVRGRTRIDFTIEPDILALNDAVVIGYGTQRKGDITSAVASVKSEAFLAGNIGDAAQLIKGKVAGLNVTKGNGDPTAA